MSSSKKKVLEELLPVLPLRGLVLFPGVISPVLLGRKHSLSALAAAQALSVDGSPRIFAVAQNKIEVDEPAIEHLYDVGVIAQVLSVNMLPGGMAKVMLEGVSAARVVRWDVSTIREQSHFSAAVEALTLQRIEDFNEAARARMLELFNDYVELRGDIPPEAMQALTSFPSQAFLYGLAPFVKAPDAVRQSLLETVSASRFAATLRKLMKEAVAVRKLDRRVEQEVHQEISKHQREYLIQEHIRKLGEELEDPARAATPEVTALRERIEQTPLSAEARTRALEETTRLIHIQPGSPEYSVVRNWIDTLLALPWGKMATERLNLRAVSRSLESGHYGLSKPKQRILEYVAVLSRAPGEQSPILCLAGPPGVGKTSLARSMAEALGRPFVRIALGGIKDEAEIRGHRRTYIGAMAGRIVQALNQAGVMNPLLLLDEVDKMGGDFRGDPASALLEVLDPEQNKEFRDHFLETGLDLSRVLFVCTANVSEGIPPVLRDRMESVHLPGYPAHEKIEIARRHLLARVRQRNGLTEEEFAIEDEALERLVRDWTREAGVRGLERLLDRLARQRALELASRKKGPALLRASMLEKRLGVSPLIHHRLVATTRHGLVNGLAYTPVGGDVLKIECVLYPGKGRIKLTGMLGAVMKESVHIAMTLLKVRAQKLGVPKGLMESVDVHLHVPEGAIPKDGPSAGVALFLALTSAFTKRPVPGLHTFTGEVSLTGAVHAVGGLPEKSLAALEAGATDLWLPADNSWDITDLPLQVRRGLKIHKLKHIDQALRILPKYEAKSKPE